jgi:PPE-repeat protein
VLIKHVSNLSPKHLDTALPSLATHTTNGTLTNKNTGHPTVGYQKAGNRLSFIVVWSKEGSALSFGSLSPFSCLLARIIAMASANNEQDNVPDTIEEPTTDGASSSGPSLEIDVRPTSWRCIFHD